MQKIASILAVIALMLTIIPIAAVGAVESTTAELVQPALVDFTYADTTTKADIDAAVEEATDADYSWTVDFYKKRSVDGCEVSYVNHDGVRKTATVEGADGYILGKITFADDSVLEINEIIEHNVTSIEYSDTDLMTIGAIGNSNDQGTTGADVEMMTWGLFRYAPTSTTAKAKKLLVIPAEVDDIVVKEIYSGVFNGTSTAVADNAIECVIFESDNIKLSDKAFSYMPALKYVIFSDGEYTVGKEMFRECSELEYVHLSTKATEIPYYTFNNCTKLKSLQLHEGLATIGENAFYGSALRDLTIPSTVTSLHVYAIRRLFNSTNVEAQDLIITILNKALTLSGASLVTERAGLDVLVRVPEGSSLTSANFTIGGSVNKIDVVTYAPDLAETTADMYAAMAAHELTAADTETGLETLLAAEVARVNGTATVAIEDWTVTADGDITFDLVTTDGINSLTRAYTVSPNLESVMDYTGYAVFNSLVGEEGAQKSALRFKQVVTLGASNTGLGTVTVGGNTYTVKNMYGLLTTASYLEGKSLTAADLKVGLAEEYSARVLKNPIENTNTTTTDSSVTYTYNIFLVNIPQASRTADIVVRTCLECTDTSDNTVMLYGEVAVDDLLAAYEETVRYNEAQGNGNPFDETVQQWMTP